MACLQIWEISRITPKSGRKKTVSRVAKIVISKSLGKRRQSTRKIASKLANKGISMSKSTVHRYLKTDLKVKSYKRPKIPRLSQKMKENRIKFAQRTINWTAEAWKKVLWSDVSPFELFSLPNRQNDRVWSKSPQRLSHASVLNFPLKFKSGV